MEVVFELLSVSGVNALVNVGATAEMVNCALAAATGENPVPVKVLVVLVYVPGAVADGTVTGTSKVQLPPEGKLPPVKLKLDVPLICDPVPHTFDNGKPVATMPDKAASRLSLNASSLVVKALVGLLIVKRIALVLVPLKVFGINALVNVGATALIVSCALAAATGAKPVPVSVLVVLV